MFNFLSLSEIQTVENNINISELIIGAVVGIILTEIYEKVVIKNFKKIYKKYLKNKHYNIYHNKSVYKFLLNYYRKNNSFNDLYECEISEFSRRILFLTDPKWSNLNVSILNNNIINVSKGSEVKYKVNNKMIKKRTFIGQKLFNGKSLYLYTANNAPYIEAKICEFYEKLTLVDKLETETYLNSKYRCFNNTKTRDLVLKNFSSSLSPLEVPVSIGCQVALVLEYQGKKYIALDKRSDKTFTYGGYYSVVPNFGLEPIRNSEGVIQPILDGYDSTLKNNVLLYNIIKEYCEELFNKTEIEEKNNQHSNPFWFYDEVFEAKALLNSLCENKSECKLLGYGFDAINCLSILAVVLYIKDINISQYLVDKCKSNWEFNNSSIKFYDIRDSFLKQQLVDDNLQNGSAFTISLALKYLENEV